MKLRLSYVAFGANGWMRDERSNSHKHGPLLNRGSALVMQDTSDNIKQSLKTLQSSGEA